MAEQIREHVEHIARELSAGTDAEWAKEWARDNDGEIPGAFEYLESALDLEYIISSDGQYRGARILVTLGGPNIGIDTQHNRVDGYWWGDEYHTTYDDQLGLDDAMREMWESR